MLLAWLLNAEEKNVALPNHCSPDVVVSPDMLEACGVYSRFVKPETLHERHPKDDEGRTVAQHLAWCLGYKGQQVVTLSASSNDESREHLNLDQQMRIVEEGVVYVDIRNAEDRWLRIEAKPGVVVVIPRGLYHRLVLPAGSTDCTVRLLRLLRNSETFQPFFRDASQNAEVAAEVAAAHEDHRFYIANPPKETIMGPPDNKENILLASPRDFDATWERVKSALSPGDVVVFLFKGASDRKTHKSWCPPCVLAEPIVKRAVQAAQLKRRVVFIQCDVERSVYLGNPDYEYRTHPFIGVVSIPFLLVLQKTDTDFVELSRERDVGERFETWVEAI